MRRFLLTALSAAILAFGQVEQAKAGTPFPMLPDASNASVPNARQNLGVPLFIHAEDAANGMANEPQAASGAADYTAIGAALHLDATVIVPNVTVTTTNGSGTMTVSPASALPVIPAAELSAGVNYKVNVPGFGLPIVASINNATGAVGMTSPAASSATYTGVTLTFEPAQDCYASCNTGEFIGAVTVTGSTLVLSAAYMDKATGGLQIVLTNGTAAWKGTIANVGSDSETVTLSSAPPAALQGSLTGVTVAWGQFLFDPAWVGGTTAATIEVPETGALTGGTQITTTAISANNQATIALPNTQSLYFPIQVVGSSCLPKGAMAISGTATAITLNGNLSCAIGSGTKLGFGSDYAATVTTLASVQGPLDATLSASVTNAVYQQNGKLTAGIDDTAAFTAIGSAIQTKIEQSIMTNDQTSIATTVYVSGKHFLASFGNNDYYAQNYYRMCGEGAVFYTQAANYFHGVGPDCINPKRVPLARASDLNPLEHLKRLSSLASGSTITIDFVGNSAEGDGSNGLGLSGSSVSRQCALFQAYYADMNVLCNMRAIGGTTWAMLDPAGPIFSGRTVSGIPPSSLPLPSWYTSTTTPWLSGYVEPDDPDLIVGEESNVDGSGLLVASVINTVAYTQTAAWKSASPGSKNPDVLIVLDVEQPVNLTSQAGMMFSTSFQRSWAQSPAAYSLANFGKIGIIDNERAGEILLDAYDPVHEPQGRAMYHRVTAATPYIWPAAPVIDWGGRWNGVYNTSTTTAANWWAYIGNEIDFLLGDGATEFAVPSGVTGGVSFGYPNNMLRVIYNTGGGELDYQVDAWDFTTPAVCSGTSGASTLTCSQAVASIWHQGATLTVPNGATGGTTPLTVAGGYTISTAGTTITLPSGTTLGATVSNVALTFEMITTPRHPSLIVPANASSSAGCTVNAGVYFNASIMFELSGDDAKFAWCGSNYLTSTQAIRIPVTRFAGYYKPIITTATPHNSSGANAPFWTSVVGTVVSSAANGNQSQMSESAPDQPRFPQMLRMVPDVYGPPTTTADFDGNQNGNHRGWDAMIFLDDQVNAVLRLR